MRPFALGLLTVIPFVSCTSGPAAPSAATGPLASSLEGGGSVTSQAVTTQRLRLRRVGGGDIVTNLADGQVIDVPMNVTIDIWAEIARLESDRARLIVDWGDGNRDFAGCGACRLENRYEREGRYTVAAKVIDLNAGDGPPVMSVSVTLRVFNPASEPPGPTPIPCVPVSGGDFEGVPTGPFPTRIPGATLSGPSGGVTSGSYVPGGNYVASGGILTITFDTDQASMAMGWIDTYHHAIGFEAFSAAGNLVATGSQPATGTVVVGWPAGTAVISGVKFRKVILYDATYLDNLTASCF